jgi:hypothetical protein
MDQISFQKSHKSYQGSGLSLSAMAGVPCGLCDTHCDEDTECVHCSGCDKWHHMKCVPMTCMTDCVCLYTYEF